MGSSAFRRLCKAEFLNYLRIREWQDVYRQLSSEQDDSAAVGASPAGARGQAPARRAVNPDGVHKSLLAGLLRRSVREDLQPPPRPARRPTPRPEQSSSSGHDSRASWFPGVGPRQEATDRAHGGRARRDVAPVREDDAAIDPAWAAPIAGDLVKRSHPSRAGREAGRRRGVRAGHPLRGADRPAPACAVHRIDPPYARELFIRHAFLESDGPESPATRPSSRRTSSSTTSSTSWKSAPGAATSWSTATRCSSSTIGASRPTSTRCAASRAGGGRRARDPRPPHMTAEDLLGDDEPEVDERDYPTDWRQGDQRLASATASSRARGRRGHRARAPAPARRASPRRLRLAGARLPRRADPGADEVAAQASSASSCPPATGRRLLPELPAAPSPARSRPARGCARLVVRRVAGANPAPADFEPSGCRRTCGSRSRCSTPAAARWRQRRPARAAAPLRGAGPRLRREGRGRTTPARQAIERSGLTTFDFDELPACSTPGIRRDRARLPGARRHRLGGRVRLLATKEDQAAAMRLGIRRLLLLATPSPAHYVREHLSGAEKLASARAPTAHRRALRRLPARRRGRRAVAGTEGGAVWTRADFERLRTVLAGRVLDDLFAVVAPPPPRSPGPGGGCGHPPGDEPAPAAGADGYARPARRAHPSRLRVAGRRRRLPRLAVYTAGIVRRVERLPDQVNRDRVWMTEVATATDLYRSAGGVLPLTAGRARAARARAVAARGAAPQPLRPGPADLGAGLAPAHPQGARLATRPGSGRSAGVPGSAVRSARAASSDGTAVPLRMP